MITNKIDKITLECLINKELYEKVINDNTKETNREYNKDRRFYKKRILNLTKQLLLKDIPDDLSQDVLQSYTNYMHTCIDYFKTLDQKDIIQEDYINISDSTNINNVLSNNSIVDENMAINKDIKYLRSINIENKPNVIDKFVIKKNINKTNNILPNKKEINLTEEKLKNKGIIKKQENNKHNDVLIKDIVKK
jgi:hypothetical protein